MYIELDMTIRKGAEVYLLNGTGKEGGQTYGAKVTRIKRSTDEVDRLRYKTSCCGDTVIVS